MNTFAKQMDFAVDKLNTDKIRRDFPILGQKIHGKPLVFLDNAASTQKPQTVIDTLAHYYRTQYANIHRGVYYLSEIGTHSYESARRSVQHFLHAQHPEEIIFVRGTTEAINLVASSYGRRNIGNGDEIIISQMEHHSNIVPWQLLCQETGAKLRIIPIDDAGDIDFAAFCDLFNDKTKLVAIIHVSNSLGTINPIAKIVSVAHENNVPVLVDGAQAVAHDRIDVQKLNCDFYAFSGHKIYGPTGIGVLYGKRPLLEDMPPYQGGGDMIKSVSFAKTTYAGLPYKFEAGTPNIAGAIGLRAAIEYIEEVGYAPIQAHERQLLHYATQALSTIAPITIIGNARQKAGIISFVIDGIHPHDVGTVLDQDAIALRTGHHCTQPVMDRYQVAATSRISFSMYNTQREIDLLVNSLHKLIKLFGYG